MNNRLISESLILTLTILMGYGMLVPALAQEEPISVGPRTQPTNPAQLRVQPQPEVLRSDPSSALGHRLIQLPTVSRASIKSKMTQTPGGPTKIGFARDIPSLKSQHDTQIQLDWVPTIAGMVGSLAIQSPDAAAIRLGIRVQSLPDTAEIRFFSDKASDVEKVTGKAINDLIELNLKAGDPEETARVYWSPVIHGEVIGVEIFLPGNTDASDVDLTIPQISHLVASPQSGLITPQDFGDAGVCNLDVMCNSNWLSTSNAVARMLYTKSGLSYWCTGTLLNDNGGTGTPYFLSANHCISSQSSASSLQTYWFYRSTGCNSGTLNPNYKTLSQGASLLFNTATTDASFMKLNGTLPSGVVFSGWTTSIPAINQNMTGVHDPRGDMQKISYGNVTSYQVCTDNGNGTFSCTTSNSSSGTFLQVVFNQGTTEGGSSGSGIFLDSNQRLTGQLYGGNTSCTNPTSPTYYGRFDKTYSLGNLGQWLASTNTYSLTFSPSQYNFGAVTVGNPATQIFTLTNTGTGTATFKSGVPYVFSNTTPNPYTILSTTCSQSLSPSASCSITLQYQPTNSGYSEGVIIGDINESSSLIRAVAQGTGTSTNTYSLAFSPSQHNFGTVIVGNPATQIFTLTNTGTGTATFKSGVPYVFSNTTPNPYTILSTTCSQSLSPSASCSITLQYQPTNSGYSEGVIIGDINESSSLIRAVAQGTGASTNTYSLAFSPSQYNFGTVIVSNPATQIFTLTNTGTGTATFKSGVPYVFSNTTPNPHTILSTTCSQSLIPSASCSITLQYQPTSSGYSEGVIIGDINESSSPIRAVAQGTGIANIASLTILKLGAGTITSSPAGINCGPTCSYSFVKDEWVVLKAQPEKGNTFMGWTGPCSGKGDCLVQMTSALTVGADFKNTYTLIMPAINLLLLE